MRYKGKYKGAAFKYVNCLTDLLITLVIYIKNSLCFLSLLKRLFFSSFFPPFYVK